MVISVQSQNIITEKRSNGYSAVKLLMLCYSSDLQHVIKMH